MIRKIVLFLSVLLVTGVTFFVNADRAEAAVDCNVDYCVSANISSNTTWATTTAEYVVQGWITVDPGVTLTINPGVIVKFEANTGLYVSGTLNAQGTSGSRIYFTSIKDDTIGGDTNGDSTATSPAAGNWEVIKTNAGGSSTIAYATIRYAGAAVFGSWFSATLYNIGGTFNISSTTVSSSTTHILHNVTGTTTIANSDIDDATSYGLRIESGKLTVSTSTIREHSYGIAAFGGALTVNGNTFSDNSTYPGFVSLSSVYEFNASGNTSATAGTKNGFQMDGAMISSMTWSKDTMPYLITNTISVPSGKTLTIKPGAVIKGDDSSGLLTVAGVLNAVGTDSDPIYFSSINDDAAGNQDASGNGTTSPSPGQWDAIKLNSGSTGNITNTIIRYGGKNTGGGLSSNIYNDGGTLTVASSTVASSTSYGIFQASGSATTSNSKIFGNTYGYLLSGGTSSTTKSAIFSNTVGMQNNTGVLTKAENNYWGGWTPSDYTPSKNPGPLNASQNPNGIGNSVSDDVDFLPYTEAYFFDPLDANYSPPAVELTSLEMRWDGSTQYATEWQAGINTWNASTSGSVDIDEAVSSASLSVMDIDDPGVSWAGFWFGSSTTIKLNEDQMSGASSMARQCVTTHEIGHALGLAHSTSTSSIMYKDCSAKILLDAQDIHDYEYLWQQGYKWLGR